MEEGVVGLACQEGSQGWTYIETDCGARRLRLGLTHTHSQRHAVTHHLVQRVIEWIRPPSNTSMALVTHLHIHTEQVLEVTEWIIAPCMTTALSLSHKYTFTHTHTLAVAAFFSTMHIAALVPTAIKPSWLSRT